MTTTTKPAQPCDAELWVMAGKYPSIPAQLFIDAARDVLNKFGVGQADAPVSAEPVLECERCGLAPAEHTRMHWCDNQSFTYAAPVAAEANNMPDAARIALDSLDADAVYLLSRVKQETMSMADGAALIRQRIEAARSSIVAAQAQTYSLNLDPAGIRALTADAITGALALGAQGAESPPEGHWLTPFYEQGRQAPAFARFAEFVASDALAISYQSLGEYRTALLRMLHEAQTNTEGS